MKKTFVAAAVLGAFAASAMAADVTLYGVIDTGLHYSNKNVESKHDVNSFDMKSGASAGNRWGLKGTEDLGNGYKVGFVLENGFTEDDGKLGNGGRLFGRQANLYVASDFGTLSFGRVGALTSGCGSYDLMKYTPFATGWAGTATKANFMLADRDRMDNTVTYVTPSFAGVQVYAQYSFERDGQETAGNERQNDRYAALGAAYKNGAFQSALVVDTVMHDYDSTNKKDSFGVTLGASYDFEVVKLFAMAQYGQHESAMGYKTSNENTGAKMTAATGTYKTEYVKVLSDEGWKGYGINLGMTAPVLGGTVLAQASWMDSETESGYQYETIAKGAESTATASKDSTNKLEAQNWGIALGYTYPFSKRTNVYTYVSYAELKLKTQEVAGGDKDTTKTKQTEFGIGLKHSF